MKSQSLLLMLAWAMSAAGEPPKTPPPTLAIVERVDAAQQTVVTQTVTFSTVTKQLPVTKEVVVNDQKKTIVELVTVREKVPVKSESIWAAAGNRAITGANREILPADLWTKLKPGETVLLADGADVDPAWLKVVRPDAIVLLTISDQALPASSGLKLSSDEQKLLDLANAERKKAGLPHLTIEGKLLDAARQHSAAMAVQQVLAHELNGQGPAERIKALGYKYRRCAENVAQGQTTPAEAVATWLNSEGHRANLLHADHTQIGVGVATAKDGQRYWTMVFATPLGS